MTSNTRKPKADRRDLYAEVTASVIESLERAGQWSRPWAELGADAASPRNAEGRRYRGVNVLLLWSAALDHGWDSGVWGTYNQWLRERAATDDDVAAGTAYRNRDGELVVAERHVRKGERGTTVVLWKPTRRKARDGEKADEDGKVAGLYLRHFTVFAAEQVEGWEPLAREERTEPERDAAAEAFFDAIGADVRHGGDRAYYTSALDRIQMPERHAFADAEHYYSTLAHEHGHWTGHKTRLDRQLGNRFGSEQYAAEELIAELTAAFVCAGLGFHATVREDHAAYVKNWVKVLRDDERAIFTAAAAAQRAADYLAAAAGQADEADEAGETDEVVAA